MDDVIVPGGTAFFPVISAGNIGSCKSITLQSGAKMTIKTGGILNVAKDAQNEQTIPEETTAYSINISGTTYYGDTNFPNEFTIYSPHRNFELTGTLWISKGIVSHPRDMAILVGSPEQNLLQVLFGLSLILICIK